MVISNLGGCGSVTYKRILVNETLDLAIQIGHIIETLRPVDWCAATVVIYGHCPPNTLY